MSTASGASACGKAPQYLALTAAIYAGEIDHVEPLLSGYQSEFETGNRPMEDIRCFYRHFGRTRPETSDFIDESRDAGSRANPRVRSARALSFSG